MIEKITEELVRGNFYSFEKLKGSQKGKIASHWDKEMKHRYLTRHPVMSEEEFFNNLDKIAMETYES